MNEWVLLCKAQDPTNSRSLLRRLKSLCESALDAGALTARALPQIIFCVVVSFLDLMSAREARRVCREWSRHLSCQNALKIVLSPYIHAIELVSEIFIRVPKGPKGPKGASWTFSAYSMEAEPESEAVHHLTWHEYQCTRLKLLHGCDSNLERLFHVDMSFRIENGLPQKHCTDHANTPLQRITDVAQCDNTVAVLFRQDQYPELSSTMVMHVPLEEIIEENKESIRPHSQVVSEIHLRTKMNESVIHTAIHGPMLLVMTRDDDNYYYLNEHWNGAIQTDKDYWREDNGESYDLLTYEDNMGFDLEQRTQFCHRTYVLCTEPLMYWQLKRGKIAVKRKQDASDSAADSAAEALLFSVPLIHKTENRVFVKTIRGIPLVCVITNLRWRFYTFQGYCKEIPPLCDGFIWSVTLRKDHRDLLVYLLVSDGRLSKYRIRM